VKFYKYQGTGNDFIMVDDRDNSFDREDTVLVNKLCHRRFGIGADGLILLRNSKGYDFEMIYYNSDGSESSMCGNGGRCIIKFAHDLGIIGDDCSFLAVDGPHQGLIRANGIVHLKMKNVDEIWSQNSDYVMNTGSPHYIIFARNISDIDIVPAAQQIRYNETYKKDGINVNFAEPLKSNHIAVRTYERGVEDETYSCGTGVVAASLAHYLQSGGTEKSIDVDVKGGKLRVTFDAHNNQFSNIFLIGPAEKVFEGHIAI
jgi:diaminopimelate epimerase